MVKLGPPLGAALDVRPTLRLSVGTSAVLAGARVGLEFDPKSADGVVAFSGEVDVGNPEGGLLRFRLCVRC